MIPTLGYPSRTAAVLALSARGMSDSAIARATGIAVSSVAALRCSARRRADRLELIVTRAALARLQAEAARRGQYTRTLAARILETVVRDDLIGAVLDDEDQR